MAVAAVAVGSSMAAVVQLVPHGLMNELDNSIMSTDDHRVHRRCLPMLVCLLVRLSEVDDTASQVPTSTERGFLFL